ncbi:MAG: ribosomal-processing cysteine protease Prp [Ruminococcus sp.]|nr:ribosomal-processing cysteine protease Prp [Ruminococcus sp.]MBQ4095876.1 ribosomal-processing cysteine protease Prp [Oscillospiraceae bacterium]MBQ9957063.1 ribosomal-processing cysteine protease Prp [Ruminococcus sp.]
MILAKFQKTQGTLDGFEITGHSGYAERGSDVVCAAVSSAVQLTLNLLNDLGAEPEIFIGDNVIRCKAVRTSNVSTIILNDLTEHFESIVEEYPKTIKITISEV